jgi:hypothetical protein
VTPEDVQTVHALMTHIRAHGYEVQRLVLPGVVEIDLTRLPPEPLSPGERAALAAPDDTSYGARGRKALRF